MWAASSSDHSMISMQRVASTCAAIIIALLRLAHGLQRLPDLALLVWLSVLPILAVKRDSDAGNLRMSKLYDHPCRYGIRTLRDGDQL